MRFAAYVRRLLSLAELLNGWVAAASAMDRAHRKKLVRYALQIADTLARAAAALRRMADDPGDIESCSAALREFGRISGYIETIVDVMRHHLDGRKLAGVKRRLEQLEEPSRDALGGAQALRLQIDRLTAAEGYFRALADGLAA